MSTEISDVMGGVLFQYRDEDDLNPTADLLVRRNGEQLQIAITIREFLGDRTMVELMEEFVLLPQEAARLIEACSIVRGKTQ